jgi:hypothetical protein
LTEHQFADEDLLRDALEEVAGADLGEYVEEPWGTSALAAAEQIAREGAAPELVEMARAAVERVAASSELLSVIEDDDAWQVRIESLRRRLG